jgi:hypothetical protein
MTGLFSVLSKLPGIAFATLAISGETIAICRGETSYYRVQTTKTAEELNTMYGVSRAQARAMLAGTMLGWHTPLADPERYDADGKLISRPAGRMPEKPGTGPASG